MATAPAVRHKTARLMNYKTFLLLTVFTFIFFHPKQSNFFQTENQRGEWMPKKSRFYPIAGAILLRFDSHQSAAFNSILCLSGLLSFLTNLTPTTVCSAGYESIYHATLGKQKSLKFPFYNSEAISCFIGATYVYIGNQV